MTAAADRGMQTLIPFDPYSYDLHEDPYPTYARLRAEAPVYYNSDGDFWALARHADVAAGFRDNVRLSNSWGVSIDPASYTPHAEKSMSFLAMDDPRHLRLRKLVSKGFTPRRVSELAGRIAELTAQHWDKCLQMGQFDYVNDFAGLLPMDVVSELLGVGPADRAHLRTQSDLLIHREEGVTDVPEAAIYAYLELHRYYTELLAERRKNLGDDLVSALIQAEMVGDDGELARLTDEEIIGFMMLMVVAGNETTTKLLANSVFWGNRNRGELATVLDDPSEQRVSDWVEETLRYDTSTQMLLRRVIEDVEFGDHRIENLYVGGDTATLTHSAPETPEAVRQHRFRGRWQPAEDTPPAPVDRRPFDVTSVDPAAVVAALADAPERLGIEGATTTDVVVHQHESHGLVYDVNVLSDGQLGRALYDPSGQLLELTPPE